jgi:alkylated DNA nucleotide flippase Atl1
VAGTPIYGGFIQENEKNAKLIGREKYRTFSDILANTNIVAAGTRYFLNLVSKATWKIEPADDSARAQELAETLHDMMHDMMTPWHRVVRRTSMYRFYGFSIQEWTAKKRENGIIGMLDVAPRAQITIERWDVDEQGAVFGVIQRAPQTSREIYLPRAKIIYAVDDTLNDSPEGLGLFRHLVEPNNALTRYQQLEGWGFETDLRGIPIGRAPLAELQRLVDEGKISSADKTAIEAPLRDLLQNHIQNPQLALLLDSLPYVTEDDKATPSSTPQWDLSLLKGDPKSLQDIAAAIERLNREMARVLGVEMLLLGTDSRGSHALSRDKTQTFSLMVDSTLQEIEEVMEKDYRDPIWELNGWPDELKPTMKTEPVQYRDIEQVTGALKDLAQAGAVMSPNDPAINEVRDLTGLSHQDPEQLMEDLALLSGNLPDDEEEEETPPEEEEADNTEKVKRKRGKGKYARKRRA